MRKISSILPEEKTSTLSDKSCKVRSNDLVVLQAARATKIATTSHHNLSDSVLVRD